MLDKFYEAINLAMDIAIPNTKGKTIDNNKPWWTKELQLMRQKLPKC